jgi:outer membrane protein assembly factor BamB
MRRFVTGRRWLGLLALALALVALPGLRALRARANTGSPTVAAWTKTIGAAFGPAVHYSVAGQHVLFAAVGSRLYAFKSEAGGAFFWTATGSQCNCGDVMGQCCQTLPAPIDHVPEPVDLSGSVGTFLFVTSENGLLYKINALTGQIAGSVDLKRAGCPNDKLKAPATVQLAEFSGASFRTIYGGHDVVFVPTAFDTSGGCATHVANQILAVDAETMTFAWSTGAAANPGFNNPYLQALDEAIEGCELDDSIDILYCAFRHPGGSQKSLIALQTHNAGGSPQNKYKLFWDAPYANGVNAGDVQVRPFLRGDKIYVANGQGTVKAYSASSGVPVWSLVLNCTTCNVLSNTWAEFRNGITSTLIAVTADGRLHSVTDTTCSGSPCGVESWCRGCVDAGGFVTQPAIDPFLGKIYIGKNDGKMHQLNLTSGVDDGWIAVDAGSTVMGDPSLESISLVSIDRLSMGSGRGIIARICPPFPVGTMTGLLPASGQPSVSVPPEALLLSGGGPLTGIGSCDTDADCVCYARTPANGCSCVGQPACDGNQFPVNPTCNRPHCHLPTHTCYVLPQNQDQACDDGNACTTDDHCVDGICHGHAISCGSPCNSRNVGAECITSSGGEGQCCSAPVGAAGFICVNTTQGERGTTFCGSCSSAVKCDSQSPIPDCSGGLCCATCGSASGVCIDLSSDASNCGACGNRCAATDRCVAGLCEPRYVITQIASDFIDGCSPANNPIVFQFQPNADDGTARGEFPGSFSFKLFGHPVTTFWISSNGLVGFDGSQLSASSQNACLPVGLPKGIIAPFWDDLSSAGDGRRVCLANLGSRMLFTWNTQRASDPSSSLKFSVILYSGTDIIDIQYSTMTSSTNPNAALGTSATIGIEDFAGAATAERACNPPTPRIGQNTGWRWNPN